MKRNSLVVTVYLLFLLAIMPGKAQVVGDIAPDFSYKDLNGIEHSLSQYSGKVVFIFVFGNRCDFCKAIGNDTETKVNQVYGARDDFQALGLDTWDNTSSVVSVGDFKQYTKITYPLLLMAGSFEALYSTTYDRVIVIGKDGRIKHKTTANLPVKDDLDNAIAVIDQLLLTTGINDPKKELEEGLAPVYPNPSNDYANLRFALEKERHVSIRIYNPIGQEVKRVVEQLMPAGDYSREFSVSDLSPGIYFVRMESGGNAWTRKMQISR